MAKSKNLPLIFQLVNIIEIKTKIKAIAIIPAYTIACSPCANNNEGNSKVIHNAFLKFVILLKFDCKCRLRHGAQLPLTSCGFATAAEIGTEFSRLDKTKL